MMRRENKIRKRFPKEKPRQVIVKRNVTLCSFPEPSLELASKPMWQAFPEHRLALTHKRLAQHDVPGDILSGFAPGWLQKPF